MIGTDEGRERGFSQLLITMSQHFSIERGTKVSNRIALSIIGYDYMLNCFYVNGKGSTKISSSATIPATIFDVEPNYGYVRPVVRNNLLHGVVAPRYENGVKVGFEQGYFHVRHKNQFCVIEILDDFEENGLYRLTHAITGDYVDILEADKVYGEYQDGKKYHGRIIEAGQLDGYVRALNMVDENGKIKSKLNSVTEDTWLEQASSNLTLEVSFVHKKFNIIDLPAYYIQIDDE